jgi:hypothetical protein
MGNLAATCDHLLDEVAAANDDRISKPANDDRISKPANDDRVAKPAKDEHVAKPVKSEPVGTASAKRKSKKYVPPSPVCLIYPSLSWDLH